MNFVLINKSYSVTNAISVTATANYLSLTVFVAYFIYS